MTGDEELKDLDSLKVSLIEESATIDKRDVRTGKVRVRTITENVEEMVRASLQSESFEITHVPIDRAVDVAPQIRTEGDVTIIPVLEEVLFVEKRLMLKEEIHLRRLSATDTIKTPVTLRRQRAVVERETPADVDTTSGKKSHSKEVK